MATAAELVAALKDVAARIRKRTTSSTVKAMADEIPPLADQIVDLNPSILERRTPNSERRRKDTPGSGSMRTYARRGNMGAAAVIPPPPPGATKLAIVTEPAGAVDGVAFTTQPAVRLQNSDSVNILQAGVNVTVSVASGAGSLIGTTTLVTDASGVATFSGVGIAGNGAHTLSFVSSGITAVTSASVSVAAASKLVMVTEPAGAVSGAAFTTQPAVRLQTSGSANVARAGTVVTVTINTGTGTLGGTASATSNASGIATFSNLQLTGSGAHTLAFASTGLTGVTSASLTVSAGVTSWLANQPSNYVKVTELDFSQAVPASSGTGITSIAGGGGWKIPFDAVANFAALTDATAPASPSPIWRLIFAAGAYGGGVVGSGPGTGFGDLYISLNSIGNKMRHELYIAVAAKWDADFEWHPISNKFFELDSPGCQLLIQSQGSGTWLGPHITNLDWAPTPNVNNSAIPTGSWHVIEFHIKYGATTGFIKVWLDGTLRSNFVNVNVPDAADDSWQEFYFRNFRGGGGETKVRDSFIYYDHIYLSALP